MAPLRPDLELTNGIATFFKVQMRVGKGSGKMIPWTLPNEAAIRPYGWTGDDVSANWPPLSIALRLLRTNGQDPKVVKEGEDWLFWQKTMGGWMAEEIGSRNEYGIWTLIAVLIMFRFNLKLANEWLALWWTWMAAMRTGDQGSFIMYGGMRSAQHGDIPGLIERAADLAFMPMGGTPPPPPFDMPPSVRSQRDGNWEWPVLTLFLPEIQASALAVRKIMNAPNSLFAAQPIWKTVVPVHFEIGTNGRGFWIPNNVNGNTPPILAGMCIDGKRYWAPEGTGILPPGKRIRQHFDHTMTAPTADGTGIAYVGEFFPNVIIPRPANAMLFKLGSLGG